MQRTLTHFASGISQSFLKGASHATSSLLRLLIVILLCFSHVSRNVAYVMQLLMEAVSDALGIIFTESYISLAALLGMFLMTFGFASAGGAGASAAPPGSTVAKFAKDEDSIRSRLALRSAPCSPRPCPLLHVSLHPCSTPLAPMAPPLLAPPFSSTLASPRPPLPPPALPSPPFPPGQNNPSPPRSPFHLLFRASHQLQWRQKLHIASLCV